MEKPPNNQPSEDGKANSELKHDYQPWPVDFAILEKLPEKGLIGGIHWRGRQVKDLVDEIAEETGAEVTGGNIAARLRVMKLVGFTQDFPSSNNKRLWARLDAGTSFLRKKEEYLA